MAPTFDTLFDFTDTEFCLAGKGEAEPRIWCEVMEAQYNSSDEREIVFWVQNGAWEGILNDLGAMIVCATGCVQEVEIREYKK